ncbi:ROK family transcriptional regulator [Devosia sp. BK]|uniref:ROK family transcriptional regulator n=1 Tax=Devosia sp. BK TaxID=2871706 RepID=UPI00293BEEA4|nr:ROK family transcriptional regulator [Devosia sp. BK]
MNDSAAPTIDLFNLGSRGLQHHGLRRANERAVLTVVGFNPGLSNAEIARMSGLAPQTVSAILNDIEAVGLIVRGEVLRGRRGQPATPIFLRAEGSFGIGVELSWGHADIVAINLHAKPLAHRHLCYEEPDFAALPRKIADAIAEMVRDWPAAQRERLTDIGIGLPSTIDENRVPEDDNVPSALRVAFAAELEQLTGLPVMLFNDGNAACWAELVARPAPRPETFIYLLVSTFLGAGLIGEGRLWQGPSGYSADLGAMLVAQPDGIPMPANAFASVTSLVERAQEAGITLKAGDNADWDWDALEPVLKAWLRQSAKVLALVIYNANAVVEGRLAVIDTILPPQITERLSRMVLEEFALLPQRRSVEIVPGTIGRLAPALGAAELPLYHRYFSRNLFEKNQIRSDMPQKKSKKPYTGEERRKTKR